MIIGTWRKIRLKKMAKNVKSREVDCMSSCSLVMNPGKRFAGNRTRNQLLQKIIDHLDVCRVMFTVLSDDAKLINQTIGLGNPLVLVVNWLQDFTICGLEISIRQAIVLYQTWILFVLILKKLLGRTINADGMYTIREWTDCWCLGRQCRW